MDVKKSNLTPDQRKERKEAKKTAKSMCCNKDKYKSIVDGWIATDDISASQASQYERGKLNKKGAKFISQEAVEKYSEGHQTDSSSD